LPSSSCCPLSLHAYQRADQSTNEPNQISTEQSQNDLDLPDCYAEQQQRLDVTTFVLNGQVQRSALLLPGAKLPLLESLGLLNDLIQFPPIMNAGYPVFIFIWQMSCFMLSFHLY
jgi:hypothetical protein